MDSDRQWISANGILSRWSISNLEEDLYTLKLSVSYGGLVIEDKKPVYILKNQKQDGQNF